MSAQMILSMWWHTTTEDRLRTFQMHFNFQTVASSLPSSDIEHCYHVILVFKERSRSSQFIVQLRRMLSPVKISQHKRSLYRDQNLPKIFPSQNIFVGLKIFFYWARWAERVGRCLMIHPVGPSWLRPLTWCFVTQPVYSPVIRSDQWPPQ